MANRECRAQTALNPKETPRAKSQLKRDNFTYLNSLERRLLREFLANSAPARDETPIRLDDYEYYSSQELGRKGATYFRRNMRNHNLRPEMVLDLNPILEQHPQADLCSLKISPDHRFLAYTLDRRGDGTCSLNLADLSSGEESVLEAQNVLSMEWANDNRTIYYTMQSGEQPARLYRRLPGASDAKMLYEERDKAAFLSLSKSRDREFIFLNSSTLTTSSVFALDAGDPSAELRRVLAPKKGVLYSAEHRGDSFIIRTNDQAPNFKIILAPSSHSSGGPTKTLISERSTAAIEDIDVFRQRIILFEREAGSPRLRAYDFDTGRLEELPIPITYPRITKKINPQFDGAIYRYSMSSFLSSPTLYEYDFAERALSVIFQNDGACTAAAGGRRLKTIRTYAAAADGAAIPITLTTYDESGQAPAGPLVLYAYGAYGASVDPSFSSERLSLLKRGVMYAIAHVRGGGEMGPAWHDGGRLLNKENSFGDLIAAAEHLIETGFTSSRQLILQGRSAGGLAAAVVARRRPDLFRLVILNSPFVDVLASTAAKQTQASLREYEEWGNPDEPFFVDYIKRYSPSSNFRPQPYPNLYITAALNDSAVPYSQIADWASGVCMTKTDSNLLLLRTSPSARHYGEVNWYDSLVETAREYALILTALGISK